MLFVNGGGLQESQNKNRALMALRMARSKSEQRDEEKALAATALLNRVGNGPRMEGMVKGWQAAYPRLPV